MAQWVDVFIPNKKSKARKRFAFVRFIKDHVGSYVNVVNGSSTAAVHGPYISFASTLVLDDSCVVERDLSKYAMGKVKDVNSITNLWTLLMDEGFSDVKLKYLWGMWVMFEFDKVDTKVNMMQHIGVKSWFHVIQDTVHDYVSDERIVWVDIEGIPLNVWSRETFMRIGKKWGETLDIEDNVDSSFGRKRLCIKTKQPVSILESFKIIFEGFTPEVSEIRKENDQGAEEFPSLVNAKKQTGGETREVSSSLSHPPGFTPEVSEIRKENDQGAEEFSSLVNAKVMNNSQEVYQEQASCKRVLWEYILTLIGRWNGDTIILGDFNEVRSIDERRGSCFNPSSARVFDYFISSSGLVDVKLQGYAFTWSHPSGSKMSKLDRFLVSERIFFIFPSITALCLDRHLSDHRSILLREVWRKNSIKNELSDIDKEVDRGVVSDTNLFRRLELQRKLHDINQMEAKDSLQKSKIKWAIVGDENSKFFHGRINKKCSQLAIRGVFDNGLWCTDPGKVKEALFNHFEARFKKPVAHRFMLNFPFNKRLSDMQAADLERNVSRDEIRLADWNCGRINLLVRTDIRLSFLGNIGTLSQVLGVGIPCSIVMQAASSIGVMVGECMSRHQAWDDTVLKLRSRLSNWNVKTLSIGGRLTLLKSVLGASPLYNMSIFKKITWASRDKILASKENGGLGVSSFHALNRALLLKWVWRFIFQDGSLCFRVIQAFYGPFIVSHPLFALELDKEVLVADKIKVAVGHSFRRPVRAGSEHQQMVYLNSLLESVSLCSLMTDGFAT
nr:RNA-directed DNA polymerase, eukaryota [Tanacetum cinerariifolium]